MAVYELTNKNNYNLAEDRKRANKFSDPLVLNFKFLIDFDNTHGLFGADKPEYMDTAVAYLRRIGDTRRLEMLQVFIELFKTFIKKYDYLIQKVDGLDLIHNKQNSHSYYGSEENSRINIECEEEIDMIVESLVFMYRTITFDEVRRVKVLPDNLLHFDSKVLLYSTGYYDSYYDSNSEASKSDTTKFVLPTKGKLNDSNDVKTVLGLRKGYNHLLFSINDCEFVVEEMGKTFINSVSNIPSDDVAKNNIVFNFKDGTYEGMFNNLVGNQINWVEYLATAALENKYVNQLNLNSYLTEDVNFVTQKRNVIDDIKKGIKDVKNNLNQNGTKDLRKTAGQTAKEFGKSFIGNPLSILTDDANRLADNLRNRTKNLTLHDTAPISLALAKSRDKKNSVNTLTLSTEQKNIIKNNFGLDLI